MTRWLLAALLLCSTARAEDDHCPRGPHTTLTIQRAERTELLRTDESIGGDQLILRNGKRELMRTVSHDFFWMCLAYSKKRGHLVGSQAKLGEGLVLRTIGYLAEDSDTIEASAFTRERYHAVAALPSRDGRWLAFVGGREELALYVLDTQRDTIRKLGPSPLEATAYTELERKTWSFQGAQLVVRYAKKLRRFKL